MMNELLEHVGKTIASVEPIFNGHDQEYGFMLYFTDGTNVRIGARGSDEGGYVTVD